MVVSFGVVAGTTAQSAFSVYTDSLVNGFQNWSWATVNLNNSSQPIHSGSRSIRVNATAWQGVSFYHTEFDVSSYSAFSFWAHGGPTGGQRFRIYAEFAGGTGPNHDLPGPLTANAWQQITVPLGSLGIENRSDVNRITIQVRGDGNTNTFYLDDIQFDAVAIPELVNVSLNATQTVRIADERHFGVNLTMWDEYFDPPHHTTSASLLQEMGTTVVRMPGGSLSDLYHWGSNTTYPNTWQWAGSFSDMVRVTTNADAQAFVVVNYGSGTPELAAAWVRHANITNNLGFKYWEIGNECYGTWEADSNSPPHHAYTYAVRATNYIAQMKAADPTIKIGVVVAPGDSSYQNGYTDHPAYNPRTGQTRYGWTPILLSTLKSLGVTPDFLVHHHYPQWTDPNNVANSPVNDVALLQSTGNWESDAADLRQQISDYFGEGGENIELVVTENNADAGQQGRQSTSLVNGLYYADSLGRLLQTEFNGFVWWDFRNGTDTLGYFGSHLYGWRNFGDLGMINGPSTRMPAFYAAKLMQSFARPGDQIVQATSDYSWLSAFASRRADGSVALLVLNKLLTTNLNAKIAIQGFEPISTANVRFFGIPNDEAARTNGPAAARDITLTNFVGAGTNFTHSFPPYSMTLFTLLPVPTPPELEVLPSETPGEFVFQIHGQQGVPYVIQTSSNLATWASVSTNTLISPTVTVTNPISPDMPHLYWRTVWQP
ncbi:MAG TPA: alpha-L-arabinofuranosidase [Verrucomicrobiota bacterium]|nr:alpha-L-arabinofuranosidase [Verrucomicrobiota bacterium]